MSGFRFNGCGVVEHFKKIKSLGTHICPRCQKLAEFTLDEVNQKIDIIYIPTFTLKSSYAVMCTKCKEGQSCSVDWAGYLMNHDNIGEVFFESTARERGWVPGGELSSSSSPQPQLLPQTAAPSIPAQQVNPAAVTPLQNNSSCCPSCKAKISAGMLFCPECGEKLRK